jgi:hypothetical protein
LYSSRKRFIGLNPDAKVRPHWPPPCCVLL